MANYKELYLKLFRGTEAAIRCLITAQQECEEDYLASPEPELKVLEPGEYVESEKQERKREQKTKCDSVFCCFCVGLLSGNADGFCVPYS